ncbi:MAG: carbon dioxide concentrating mechanism protein CcmL [Planctomycetales bacterium]|nr:carbon dioxide concentrating mechanism protein CcmL [Planctomycetales bacterium]
MRIAEIIGTVTLNRAHPSLRGATFKLAVPLSLDNLLDRQPPQADQLVLYDELGSGVGSRVALSESREAAAPFLPQVKPIDAYNAAILDDVHLDPHALPPPDTTHS